MDIMVPVGDEGLSHVRSVELSDNLANDALHIAPFTSVVWEMITHIYYMILK
jgi:hypothetical protein